MAKTGRQSFQFMLRLTDELRDGLRREAERNNRSMNAEIISRLDGSFEQTSYEIDFENGGSKLVRSEYSRRKHYYKALSEDEAVKQIMLLSEELKDAAAALFEMREQKDLDARKAAREGEE